MTPLYISIGFLVYYIILQLLSDFIRAGQTFNTPNKLIFKLRSEYGVNIKTFQKNSNHNGFAWFKTIFLNENLFKRERGLMLTFYHELYHLKNKHKQWVLVMRFFYAFIPSLALFIPWWIVVVIFIGCGIVISIVQDKFEAGANKYASENITANDAKTGRNKAGKR